MTAIDQRPVPEVKRVPSEGRPRLRRSREDRVLFGVCGGIGRYLAIDPVLVRVAFVLLAVVGGSGVLLYLIGLVAIPPEAPGETVAAGQPTMVSGSAVVIGTVLVAIGWVLLVGPIIPAFGNLFGPLVLLALGVAVILAARR